MYAITNVYLVINHITSILHEYSSNSPEIVFTLLQTNYEADKNLE